MSRKFRYCSDKVTHLTVESARAMQDSLEEKMGVRPNVYKCSRCGYYHVGYDGILRQRFSEKARRIYKEAHDYVSKEG